MVVQRESSVSKAVKCLLLDASSKSPGRARAGSLTHSPTLRRRPRKGSILTETKRVSYIEPISDDEEDCESDTAANEQVRTRTRAQEKINQYVVLGDLGRGAQGVVKKALNEKDGRKYAIKMISKRKLKRNIMFKRNILRPPGARRSLVLPPNAALKSAEDDEMKKEIAILKKLDHPNIVKCVEIMDDPEEDNMYMVFELMENGCIMDVDERRVGQALAPEVARKFFVDLLLGIEYLHANKVIHRDIKPQNLLLDSNYDLHIADFGVSHSCTSTSDLLNKSAGSPAFLAPECLHEDVNTYAGRPIDIWAMGVTLYCFMFGKVPFTGVNILDLHDNIQQAEPDYGQLDSNLVDLLKGMLRKSPAERLTMREVRDHPWITTQGTEPIQITEEANTVPVDVNEAEIGDALNTVNCHDLPSPPTFRTLNVSTPSRWVGSPNGIPSIVRIPAPAKPSATQEKSLRNLSLD